MMYEASIGVVHQPSSKLVNSLIFGLPALISVILIAAALSSHSYSAAGKNPNISSKPGSTSAKTVKVNQPSSDGAPAATNTTSGSAFVASPSGGSTSSSASAPQSSTAVPASSGGMGGGSSEPSTSSTSSSPLPATITTPPLDVQAAGKQILSTSPTSLTIN